MKDIWGYKLQWALKGLDPSLQAQIWDESPIADDKGDQLLAAVEQEFKGWFNRHLLDLLTKVEKRKTNEAQVLSGIATADRFAKCRAMETLTSAIKPFIARDALSTPSLLQSALSLLILLATILALRSLLPKTLKAGDKIQVDNFTIFRALMGGPSDKQPGQDYLTYILLKKGTAKMVYIRMLGRLLLHTQDVSQTRKLCAQEGTAVVAKWPYSTRTLLGEKSVSNISDTRTHAAVRRVVVEFFTPKAIESYIPFFVQAGNRCIDRWIKEREVKYDAEIRSVTLELIMECILGLKHTKEFEGLVQLHTKGIFSPAICLPGTTYYKAWHARKAMVTCLEKAIADVRSGKELPLATGSKSVLQKMVNIADKQNDGLFDDKCIIDQMIIFLFAGHETTASTLRMVFEWMHLNPGTYDKLREEQRRVVGECGSTISAQSLAKMTYMEAVVKEMFRLSPVIPAVHRKLMKDVDINGHLFKKGEACALPTVPNKLFLDEVDINKYPNMPMTEFHPERWLQPDSNQSPLGYMPFGFGARHCPGKNFAIGELKVILALLVRRTSWKLLSGRNYVFNTFMIGITPPADNTPIKFTANELE